jgi:hypothetical protein
VRIVKSASINFVAKCRFSKPTGSKIHSYHWTVSGYAVSRSNPDVGDYKYVKEPLRSIKLAKHVARGLTL